MREELCQFTLVRRCGAPAMGPRMDRADQRHQVAERTVRGQPEPATVFENPPSANVIRRDAGEESIGGLQHLASEPLIALAKQSRGFRSVVSHSKCIQVANTS